VLGARIKKLREEKGIVQRQVASRLEVDFAFFSKMENDDKPVSRSYNQKRSELFETTTEELETLWLSDKMMEIIQNEPLGLESLRLSVKRFLELKQLRMQNQSKIIGRDSACNFFILNPLVYLIQIQL